MKKGKQKFEKAKIIPKKIQNSGLVRKKNSGVEMCIRERSKKEVQAATSKTHTHLNVEPVSLYTHLMSVG